MRSRPLDGTTGRWSSRSESRADYCSPLAGRNGATVVAVGCCFYGPRRRGRLAHRYPNPRRRFSVWNFFIFLFVRLASFIVLIFLGVVMFFFFTSVC